MPQLAQYDIDHISLPCAGSVTSHGTSRTDVTFPDVPWSEWHIDARDIQVARRDDGREWKLGGGAFGEVSR
jgi:hypothetical protein